MNFWPQDLESCFLVAGWTEEFQQAAIQSDMTSGFPESRETHSDPVVHVTGRIVIPRLQFTTLYHFYENTLKDGCLRFRRTDPADPSKTYDWRFRSPPIVSPLSDGEHLAATMSLERIPATLR